MRNLESIRLIVLDVDGTMTDGGIYIDNNGKFITRYKRNPHKEIY